MNIKTYEIKAVRHWPIMTLLAEVFKDESKSHLRRMLKSGAVRVWECVDTDDQYAYKANEKTLIFENELPVVFRLGKKKFIKVINGG